jgi:ATP-dependent DNA helicase RecG
MLAGGTVVFGVRERVLGCDKAIVGIDFAPDLEALNATLYDSIDPKLLVQFEWLMYGSRCLLLMHVYPSMPPYTTTSSKETSFRVASPKFKFDIWSFDP